MAQPLFLVERYLPGADAVALDALRTRLEASTEIMRAAGRPVAWLQSVVVLDDDTCLCLFRAASQELVAEANARAAADWERISPVLAAGEL
jgi:hypothetical protein